MIELRFLRKKMHKYNESLNKTNKILKNLKQNNPNIENLTISLILQGLL